MWFNTCQYLPIVKNCGDLNFIQMENSKPFGFRIIKVKVKVFQILGYILKTPKMVKSLRESVALQVKLREAENPVSKFRNKPALHVCRNWLET